jgi:thioesterase domain-containing protein
MRISQKARYVRSGQLNPGDAPAPSSLILLNSGTVNPPVFLAAGAGGDVREFTDLAGHVRTDHPIYGMQAKGRDGTGEPCEYIEQMAEYNLKAIRELQPHGPYFLIGYSLGGLVALEMAQRLCLDKESIGLLLMIETYPHKRFLPPKQKLRRGLRVVKYHLSRIAGLPMRRAITYAAQFLAKRFGLNRNVDAWEHPSEGAHKGRIVPMRDSDYKAWMNYCPRYYAGSIKYVQARTNLYYPDAAPFWTELVGSLEVATTSGDHVGMVTQHPRTLASILSTYLSQSLPSQ